MRVFFPSVFQTASNCALGELSKEQPMASVMLVTFAQAFPVSKPSSDVPAL